MTQTATEINLSEFTDKKVTLVYTDESGQTQSKEGTIQAASPIGVIFKEKGKSDVNIVEAGNIQSVEVAPEKEPNVSVKKLRPVPEGRVRQHLADRHGFLPADLNAMSEASAKELHDGLDHGPLAHRHEEPKAKAEAGDGDDSDIDYGNIEGADPEPESDDDDA